MVKVRSSTKTELSESVIKSKSVTDFGRSLLSAINKLQNSEDSMKYVDLKNYLHSVFDTVEAVHTFDLKKFFKKAVQSGFIVLPKKNTSQAMAETINEVEENSDSATLKPTRTASKTKSFISVSKIKFADVGDEMSKGDKVGSETKAVIEDDKITKSKLKRLGTGTVKGTKGRKLELTTKKAVKGKSSAPQKGMTAKKQAKAPTKVNKRQPSRKIGTGKRAKLSDDLENKSSGDKTNIPEKNPVFQGKAVGDIILKQNVKHLEDISKDTRPAMKIVGNPQ